MIFFLALCCKSVEAIEYDGPFLYCFLCFVFTVEVTHKPAKLELKFIENRSQDAKLSKFVIKLLGTTWHAPLHEIALIL